MFDLEGKLVIDYSELDRVQSEVDRRLGTGAPGAAGATGAAPSAAANAAGLDQMLQKSRTVRREVEKPMEVKADTRAASQNWDTFSAKVNKDVDQLQTKAAAATATAATAQSAAAKQAAVNAQMAADAAKVGVAVKKAETAPLVKAAAAAGAAAPPTKAPAAAALDALRAAMGPQTPFEKSLFNKMTSTEREVWQMQKNLKNTLEERIKLNVDTTMARENLKKFEQTFSQELFTIGEKSKKLNEQIAADAERAARQAAKAAGAGQAVGAGARGEDALNFGGSRLTNYRQMRWGLIGMAAGFGVAGMTAYGAVSAADQAGRMDTTTAQVFGEQAQAYIDEAEAMSDATGFLNRDLQLAQVTFKKFTDVVSQYGTDQGRGGMNAGAIQGLTELSTNLAATTGLPQFANNIAATSQAVIQGISGADQALADFGIRLDDLYVMSLPVNAAFKDLGDKITPAQIAQARYNAILAQTPTLADDAAKASESASGSIRAMKDSWNDAMVSVGEAIAPVAKTIADFISSIPPELLKAGIWTTIFGGLAVGIASALVGLRALTKAIIQMATTAMISSQTMGGGGGLLGKILGKIPGVGKPLIGGAKGVGETLAGEAAAKGAAQAAGSAAKVATEVAKTAAKWLPAVGGAGFEAAAGGGGGMAAAAGGAAAATGTGMSTGSLAAGGLGAGASATLALPAVIAAGTAIYIKKLDNDMNKLRDTEEKYGKRQVELAQQATAKQTGMGNRYDPAQSEFVAAKVRQIGGQSYYYNRFGKMLSQEAQQWLRGASPEQLAGLDLKVIVEDRTTAGVNVNNAQSNAPSSH